MNSVDFSLYLIADVEQIKEDMPSSVKLAIDGGVKAIQLRGKNITAKELLKIGERLRHLTHIESVKLFINDRIDVAMAIQADGVHLGQNSMPVKLARETSGDRFIIGVSTHSLKEAMDAEAGGADFITVGPIFETESKLRYGSPVGLTTLADVCRKVKIPVFAIGGISIERVNSVMKEGAHGVAVISAILKAESVYDAAVNMLDELRCS
ncbi:MAG: thiamine-phosphate diphosphorylase [Nitrospirae bacterium RBG_16_43_11]|nr:MAG: thiamine-phosphate diphosphorylase [Nitrospirae bacterium RBG_16_43_11]